MKVRNKHADQDFEIPLIPMIDCLFVLLVFFLVATTLKKTEKELPIDLPQSGAALDTEQKEDVLVIGLDRAGQKFFRSEPVTTEVMSQRLAAAALANPNRRVRLDADVSTPYAAVVEMIEMCEFNNLRNVGFRTKSPGK
ncbi:MAG TPA: biopolymer transporter ExbD [Chthoniobacterales bacterium]